METIPYKNDANDQSESNKLRKILGVTFGLAIVIGGMLGVGILRTPGIVAAGLGSVWLIIAVWIFGGIYTLFAANIYAELGTMIPEAGGPYVFAKKTYGKFGGFLIGWSDWFINTGATAYLAVAMAEYAGELFPVLAGYVPLLACLVILFFAILHSFGLRAGSNAQKITSLIKVTAFFILIVACFVFGGSQNPTELPVAAKIPEADPWLIFAAVILSMQAVIETYAGYNSIVYFSEENADPGRSIPRALFGGVLLVTAVYLLFNFAILYVLPVAQIAASKLPAADAAASIFGEIGGTIILGLSLISLLGIINAVLLQTPRTIFSMSRDRMFISRVATVSKNGTPVFALFLTTIFAVVLAATGTFESLLAITAFTGVTVDCSVFLSLFLLRKTEPDMPRPFKAWGYPFVPLIVLVVSILLLVGYVIANLTDSLISLAVIAVSYPIYLIVKWSNK